MKNYLANSGLISAALILSASTSMAQTVAKSDVRQEALVAAEGLLEAKPKGIPATAKDPFNSDSFSEVMGMTRRAPSDNGTVAAPTGPRSDRDLLAAIAANLRPTGNFVIGGEQTLIFSQKRVKAGTSLTINFEGNEYTIEITAIDRANFTIRYNREEITRPIK